MPDQLAHIIFAREAALRAGLSARLDLTSAAFRAGAFGPDPLFNDVSASIRAFGLGMHKRPVREAMERMRAPICDNMPLAAEYAAPLTPPSAKPASSAPVWARRAPACAPSLS